MGSYYITTLLVLVLLSMLNAITQATHFLAPTQFEQWETGTKVKIYLKGGNCTAADLKMVDTGGFMLKNMGYIAKDFEYNDEQVFEFQVWDELPPGNTYQLAFHPRLDCGMAATAFSQVFTIVNNKNKKMLREDENMDYGEAYYFASEVM